MLRLHIKNIYSFNHCYLLVQHPASKCSCWLYLIFHHCIANTSTHPNSPEVGTLIPNLTLAFYQATATAWAISYSHCRAYWSRAAVSQGHDWLSILGWGGFLGFLGNHSLGRAAAEPWQECVSSSNRQRRRREGGTVTVTSPTPILGDQDCPVLLTHLCVLSATLACCLGGYHRQGWVNFCISKEGGVEG